MFSEPASRTNILSFLELLMSNGCVFGASIFRARGTGFFLGSSSMQLQMACKKMDTGS